MLKTAAQIALSVTQSFTKTALSKELIRAALGRHLRGVASRGAIRTPLGMVNEQAAVFSQRPRLFMAAYPEYRGDLLYFMGDYLRRLRSNPASTRELVTLMRSYRTGVPRYFGGNPGTRYRPYDVTDNVLRNIHTDRRAGFLRRQAVSGDIQETWPQWYRQNVERSYAPPKPTLWDSIKKHPVKWGLGTAGAVGGGMLLGGNE